MKRRLTIALTLALFECAANARQNPAFRAKVESVRVDVLVTDNGQPILGLGPADFELLDNGVPQQVELVSFDQVPLNVILALDMSDSVAGERLEQLRGAGGGLLAALHKEDQAALVTFSHVVAMASGDVGFLATMLSVLLTLEDSAAPVSPGAGSSFSVCWFLESVFDG